MKTLLLFIAISMPALLRAQPPNASDLLEGGKTLIELIRVIKPQKAALNGVGYKSPDSCSLKKVADLSFKNRTGKTMIISLYFRVGNSYEPGPLSLQVSPSSKESLFDVRAGVYKYKIETDSAGQRTLLHEGELRLAPCEKVVRYVKG